MQAQQLTELLQLIQTNAPENNGLTAAVLQLAVRSAALDTIEELRTRPSRSKEADDGSGTLSFTKKELNTMPKSFQKAFIANNKLVRYRYYNGLFQARYRRDGFNIEVASKDFETMKKKFIAKLTGEAEPHDAPVKEKRRTAKNVLFSDYARDWLSIKEQTTKPSTYKEYLRMFEVNLKPLLLEAPLKNNIILGLDPAYRTGCKIAVIDKNGAVLDTTVIYPTPPQSKTEESIEKLKKLIEKYNVNIISIGNGTASKEAEIFVAELIKHVDRPVSYAVVSEAGASVYSASKLGAEEFPDYDVSLRSAVSIARRLQDPLAELIKIDVKSIGVGQYQHDMPQNRLTEVLTGVVEDCVNSVGVDLNTASPSLLSYVSGLNMSIAKNIVTYRTKIKGFKNREELLSVPKLGPKAYEQCAGFLRVVGGENILDNTAVHPESYDATRKLLKLFNMSEEDVKNHNLVLLPKLIEEKGEEKVAKECGVGVPTLKDITSELQKPGRDIRESMPKPVLRSDVIHMEDLQPGMIFDGVVRNVVDFGAFVDIGVHQDGLVHISQLSDGYVKHPSEVVKVGDKVKVKVLSVDLNKKRISLTMKGIEEEEK